MKKISSWVYLLAMIMSCIGMSISFLEADVDVNFLQIAVMLTLVYFLSSIIGSRGMKKNDIYIMILIMFTISTIVLKMFYFEQIVSIAPLMMISNILLLATMICGNNGFCYSGYVLINICGAIALIVGISEHSHTIWGAVQIGYINPQIIGAWALMYAIGALLSFDYFFERVKHKGLFLVGNIIIYGYMIYVVLITEARFSLIVLIVLFAFRCLPIINAFNYWGIRFVFALFPVLFMFFSQMLAFTEMFSNMDGGSLLNGRERIWAEAMESVILNPLFGVSYKIVNANTYYSHNIFVDYSVLFGIFVTMSFFIILSYIMIQKVPFYDKHKKVTCGTDRLSYDAFVSFCLVMVSASVEGAFFTVGAGGLYLFTYGLLFIAIPKDKNLEKNKLGGMRRKRVVIKNRKLI